MKNKRHSANRSLNTWGILGLTGAALTSQVAVADVKLSLSTGTDNNPYRFSDDLKDDIAVYFDNRLEYQYQNESGFFAGISLHSISHNDAFDAANRKHNAFNLGYAYQFNDQHRLAATFTLGEHNQSYLSRTSGSEVIVLNESIINRFDYGWSAFDLNYQFNINEQHQLYASLDYQKRNYVDFTELAVSDLDYTETAFRAGWIFNPNEDWDINLEFATAPRDFDSRENRDALGTALVGDPLSYNIQRVSVDTSYQLSTNHSLVLNVFTENKDDQIESFYNSEFSDIALAWRWQFEGYGILETKVQMVELVTENELSQEEQESDSSGYSYNGSIFSVSYLYDIWAQDEFIIDGYVRLTHSDIDAVRPEYIYTRQQLQAGVTISL